MLKNYLTKKGVQFDYIDVDEHPEKFAEVQVWSNSIIIPQLAVGMTVVVGLNLPRVIEIVDGLNGR
jgi:glutaredoxin